MPGTIDISMRKLSFHEWLKNRPDEAPDAERLALLIAQSGAAGISPDELRRLVHLSPNTLADLLRALVATGQLAVFKVNRRAEVSGDGVNSRQPQKVRSSLPTYFHGWVCRVAFPC